MEITGLPTDREWAKLSREETEQLLSRADVLPQTVWNHLGNIPITHFDLVETVFPSLEYPRVFRDPVRDLLGVPYNPYKGTPNFRVFPRIMQDLLGKKIWPTGSNRFVLWQVVKYLDSGHWVLEKGIVQRLIILYRGVIKRTPWVERRIGHLEILLKKIDDRVGGGGDTGGCANQTDDDTSNQGDLEGILKWR